MLKVEKSVTIDSTVEKVWEVISNPQTFVDQNKNIENFKIVEQNENERTIRYTFRTSSNKKQGMNEKQKLFPPERIESVAHFFGGFSFLTKGSRWRYEITPIDGKTNLSIISFHSLGKIEFIFAIIAIFFLLQSLLNNPLPTFAKHVLYFIIFYILAFKSVPKWNIERKYDIMLNDLQNIIIAKE